MLSLINECLEYTIHEYLYPHIGFCLHLLNGRRAYDRDRKQYESVDYLTLVTHQSTPKVDLFFTEHQVEKMLLASAKYAQNRLSYRYKSIYVKKKGKWGFYFIKLFFFFF